jgi:hypothetical protein
VSTAGEETRAELLNLARGFLGEARFYRKKGQRKKMLIAFNKASLCRCVYELNKKNVNLFALFGLA